MKTAISFLFCALMTLAASAQAAVPADHNKLCKVIGWISLVVMLYCLFVLWLGGVYRMNRRPEDCGECDQEPAPTKPDTTNSYEMGQKRDGMKRNLNERINFAGDSVPNAGDANCEIQAGTGEPPQPTQRVDGSATVVNAPLSQSSLSASKAFTPEEHNRFPNGRWS